MFDLPLALLVLHVYPSGGLEPVCKPCQVWTNAHLFPTICRRSHVVTQRRIRDPQPTEGFKQGCSNIPQPNWECEIPELHVKISFAGKIAQNNPKSSYYKSIIVMDFPAMLITPETTCTFSIQPYDAGISGCPAVTGEDWRPLFSEQGRIPPTTQIDGAFSNLWRTREKSYPVLPIANHQSFVSRLDVASFKFHS